MLAEGIEMDREKSPILISNPTILLKFLRHFGHIIINLGVSFVHASSVNLCDEIENYVAEYCCDSLQHLHLEGHKTKLPFENFPKPLKNVKFLKIVMILEQKTDHIHFLNEKLFPNVKHIFIFARTKALYDSERIIHYENIENFTITCGRLENKLPFSFGNLKHLILTGSSLLNDALCEFIDNLEHLQTLKIMRFCGDRSHPNLFEKFLQLPNVLSNVVEIQFQYQDFMWPSHILNFIKQSRKLRKLSFHVHKIFDYNQNLKVFQKITSNLSVEWKFNIIYPFTHSFCLFFYVCYVIERIID